VEVTGKRLLVADDDVEIRDLLAEYLGQHGCEVKAVADGVEALEALAEASYDAAVVDLSMPRMDGVELIRRAARKHPELRFVVVTGYSSDRAVIDTMSAGAVRFLTKPFRLDEVLAAVKTALRAGRKVEEGEGEGAGMDVQARPDWIEITAPSRNEYRDRLEHLFEVLSGRQLPAREMEDIRIALGEIVANAIEWGNREDADKPLKVSYCLFPEEIVFRIEDLGPGFDPSELPAPGTDPVELMRIREEQGKRPGGLGLAIAHKVMDRIIYNRLGNSVVMSRRLLRHRGT
jgi:CheY-like chemotaxis protein/anti-sigma regulatory factor (Ser/Thr protein kinase)